MCFLVLRPLGLVFPVNLQFPGMGIPEILLLFPRIHGNIKSFFGKFPGITNPNAHQKYYCPLPNTQELGLYSNTFYDWFTFFHNRGLNA